MQTEYDTWQSFHSGSGVLQSLLLVFVLQSKVMLLMACVSLLSEGHPLMLLLLKPDNTLVQSFDKFFYLFNQKWEERSQAGSSRVMSFLLLISITWHSDCLDFSELFCLFCETSAPMALIYSTVYQCHGGAVHSAKQPISYHYHMRSQKQHLMLWTVFCWTVSLTQLLEIMIMIASY